jgi:dipeptidyl aminopeptidase/acylaminoacyl peptidase
MTVPFGSPPDSGWPVIIFNHGYIHPPDYRTTENYVTYMDMLASSGYIVFKSDFRRSRKLRRTYCGRRLRVARPIRLMF